MNAVVRNLVMGALTALAVLAAVEGGMRLFNWPDPGIYDGDLAGLWTLRADLPERAVRFEERHTSFRVRTDSHGWRDENVEPGALLCLGDSTTFGWGVEEEEAWPARLAARLGSPVTNAGVPGYTTHQGRQRLAAALATQPGRVILGFLVRDADLAPVADVDRPPSRPPPPLQILRALRGLRPQPAPPAGAVFRVSPDDYVDNLRKMVAEVRAAGAEPLLLAFPMRVPATEHLQALRSLSGEARVLEPALAADAFFDEDPVHLTAEGNDQLASWLADALR